MAKPEVKRAVQDQVMKGEELGVFNTPTMFVNGDVFVGTPSSKDFEHKLERLLQQSSDN
jgi:protein-disulfide isomerase